MRSHQSGVEGQNHLPQHAHQDTNGILGCERTLQAHVQLSIHQYPQVLLRAAFNLFIPHSLLIMWTAPTEVWELVLGLAKLCEVHVGPPLKPVQVPLDGIPFLQCVHCTTQLGVVCKPAEGALDPSMSLIKILNSTRPNMGP